jgi:SAM-dependent methyltransferase
MPETVDCSLCGPAPSRLLYTTRPRAPYKPLPADDILPERNWRLCAECGLIYLSPRLTPAEAATLYDDDYHDVHHEELRTWEFHKKKEFIERQARGGRLLDIGCGYGYFQYRLGDNWQATGLEISAAAVSKGRERLGVDIRQGTLEQAAFEDGSFDAVTMWDVLEHLPDPVAELRRAHRVLRPGGVIGISTCDASALAPRVARSYWYCINTPDHQYAFTLAWLKKALAATGFEYRESLIHNKGFDFFTPFARRLALEGAKASIAAAAAVTRAPRLKEFLARKAPPLVPMFRDIVMISAVKKA